MEWNKNGSVTVRKTSPSGNVSCAVKWPPSGFSTYCDVRTPLLKVWMKLNTLIAPRLPNAHYESLGKMTLSPSFVLSLAVYDKIINTGTNMLNILKTGNTLINKAVDFVTYQVLSAGIKDTKIIAARYTQKMIRPEPEVNWSESGMYCVSADSKEFCGDQPGNKAIAYREAKCEKYGLDESQVKLQRYFKYGNGNKRFLTDPSPICGLIAFEEECWNLHEPISVAQEIAWRAMNKTDLK